MHKTANVLNKLPRSVHSRAKGDLHEIWMAETRAQADKAFDAFLAKYQPKYETNALGQVSLGQCLQRIDKKVVDTSTCARSE
jgi:hypothetical protein